MSGPDALIHDDDIEVSGILAALAKRWWLIVFATAIAGAGLFLFLSSLDERYLSTTRVLVKDQNTVFTRATSENAPAAANQTLDAQAVRSEVEVASSDRLLLQVIDELNLIDVAEFGSSSGSSGLLGLLFPKKERDLEDARIKALSKFRKRFSAFAIENSRVIVIEFWAHDPDLAQRVAQTIANLYVASKIKEKADSQNDATGWLDPRIRELETAVNEKEAAVADFRSNEDLLRVDDNNALLATQQLSQVSTELSQLKAERSRNLSRVASIEQALSSGVSLDAVPEVQQSPLIQRLREREVDLVAQISDLSVTLLPGHPRLKSLQSQLSRLRSQIATAAQDVVKSLQRNVDATREAEADLAKEIIRLKSEAARVDAKLVELRAREREAEAARQLLTEYKSRSLEAKSRQGLTLASAEIISPATYPTSAYFPKVIPFTAAGTAGVFVLTCLFIITGSLLTTPATLVRHDPGSNEDVAPDQVTDLHMAMKAALEASGAVPEPAPHPVMPSVVAQALPGGDVDRGLETAFRHEGLSHPDQTLSQPQPMPPEIKSPEELVQEKVSPVISVSEISKRIAKTGRGRIAVISPGGQPGSKSACLIARHLAQNGADTVVIDFASGATTTSDMTGQKDLPGFFNLLSGSIEAENALHEDKSGKAHVVPAGTSFPNQSMPPAEEVSDLVDAIAAEFDFCVLDCGNAELEDLNVVADDDTIAVISVLGATKSTCDELHRILKNDGFEDILRTAPNKNDHAELGLETV